MEIFSKIDLLLVISKITPDDLDFDVTEYVYHNKKEEFTDKFEIVVNTLNDLLFGTFYIVLSKSGKNWHGKNILNKIGCVPIRIKHLFDKKMNKYTFDIDSAVDFQGADFYGKNSTLLGTLTIQLKINQLNSPLDEEKTTGMVQKIANKLFNADVSMSFDSIKNAIDVLFNGNTLCNFKTVIGMILIDGYLINKMKCQEDAHIGNNGCFINNCLIGYSPIPKNEALKAIRCVDYSLGAYTDSLIWKLIIKPTLYPYEDVKDQKLKAILERINIKKDKFIKYFESNLKSISYVIFIDDDSLVISFRGTLSHFDVINDLNANYTVFFDGYAHAGITNLSYSFVSSELDNIKEILIKNNLKKIIFTGHSLGGAVATLVHLIVTKNKYFSNIDEIKTITFSPPPTVSESFLNEKIENLIAYNFGNDLIPRVSIGSLLDFKFLCISLFNFFHIKHDTNEVISRILEINQYLNNTCLFPKLYHPGTVYHIKDSLNENKEKIYGFKNVNPKFFSSLNVNKDCITDHILTKHLAALKYCVEEESIEPRNDKN